MFTNRRSGLADTLKTIPSRRSRELKKDREEEKPRDHHRASSRQKQRHRYYSDDEDEPQKVETKPVESKNEDQKLNELMDTLKIDPTSTDNIQDVTEIADSRLEVYEDESKPSAKNDEEEPVERKDRRRDESQSPARDRRRREPSESPVRDRRRRESSESPVRERRKSSGRRSRRRDHSESPVRTRRNYRDDSESPVRTRRNRRDDSESPQRARRYRDESESPVRTRRNRRDASESPVRDRKDRDRRRDRDRSESPQRSDEEVEAPQRSDVEEEEESTLLKLSKNTITRLAKASRVPSLSSNVYDGLRALAGEFVVEMLESAHRRSNNEPISFSVLEPLLERRIGSEIPDLENTEISITLFSNFVKDIATELETQIKKEAILYLHNATEYYLLKTLRRAVDMSKNARRSRVTMNDVLLASGR